VETSTWGMFPETSRRLVYNQPEQVLGLNAWWHWHISIQVQHWKSVILVGSLLGFGLSNYNS